MTRTIRRATTITAFAAAAAFVIPGLAHAAPTATVSITTGVNSAKVTIMAAPVGTPTQCAGPWVYSEADANLIRQSPTLDIANHPENWMKGDPVSPTGGNTSTNQAAWVYLDPGETKTADIAFIREGNYVAGSFCATVEDTKLTYVLTETPFTIGKPKPEPGTGGAGSLGSLNFGS